MKGLCVSWPMIGRLLFLPRFYWLNLRRNKEGVSSCHVIVGAADIMFRKYENVRENAT